MNIDKILLIFLCLIYLSGCNSEQFTQGKALYTQHCSNCHMEDGSGLASLIPTLVNADYYQENITRIPCIIIHGLSDTILVNQKTYAQKMEGIKNLNSVEICNIMNYINHSWGNSNGVVNIKDIERQLENCQD